jgi:hypothetical protein
MGLHGSDELDAGTQVRSGLMLGASEAVQPPTDKIALLAVQQGPRAGALDTPTCKRTSKARSSLQPASLPSGGVIWGVFETTPWDKGRS